MAYFKNPTAKDMKEYSDKFGYRLEDYEIEAHLEYLKGNASTFERLYNIPEPTLPVKYPRLPGYQPTLEEDPLRGWAWRCHIDGASSGLLAGKRVAIKDSVMVAGVPMMNGSRILEGFIPEQDATIVSRILDAAGTVVGKANCTDHCLSAGGWHTGYGPMRNPNDPSRNPGGSSSGSAIVEADMAVGGDQGGSIRTPSSMCGIVGLKPTHGLVPYTGVCPIENSIDHVGPMAHTVHDAALMLQVMAGYDNGADCRQPSIPFDVPNYLDTLDKPVNTFKLAVITEAFDKCAEDVRGAVKTAIAQITDSHKFASVKDVSAPFHHDAYTAWLAALTYGVGIQCVGGSGYGVGSSGLQCSRLSDALWRGSKAVPHTGIDNLKVLRIIAEFMRDRHGLAPYHRAQSIAYDCGLKYDELLKEYDALLMPTLTVSASKIPDKDTPLSEVMIKSMDMMSNTGPFDSTHHPALTLNAGFSAETNMPIGLQIVGNKFRDDVVLQIGKAVEDILKPLQTRHDTLIDGACSWESCAETQAGMLNVHIVCHTHDDAGWKKTVDQYYYGAKQTSDDMRRVAGVQWVLDSVLTQLLRDPKRRFSYCESAYFWRWWKNQDEHTKDIVKRLVNSGQLEFTGGGWVQNDEATTHYSAVIDQLSLGLRFLNDTFGRCGQPKMAWQIDAFGHSREQANLFTQMGMKGVYFTRLHFNDKAKRLAEKSMEVEWLTTDGISHDTVAENSILAGAFYDDYGPPDGFCFGEFHCSDDPIMDDPLLDGYNVDARVDEFIQIVLDQAKHYRTKNIILPFGSDFRFGNAITWFSNLDKLIKYTNERQAHGSKVNLLYSTPGCYLKALRDSQTNWPSKTDDFFPMSDKPHKYWTGFYASRPSLKGYTRHANSFLQACKQLTTISQLPAGNYQLLARAVALLQHHDAVTGTELQHVADDYAKRLSIGIAACEKHTCEAIKRLSGNLSFVSCDFGVSRFCPLLNVSVCRWSQELQSVIAVVYNPLSLIFKGVIRIPVASLQVRVTNSNGTEIQANVMETFVLESQFPNLNTARYEVLFEATLPPLGFASFRITAAATAAENVQKLRQNEDSHMDKLFLQNRHLRLDFSATSGLLTKVTNLVSGLQVSVRQNFFWYRSAELSQTGHQASGPYIFRPNGTLAFPVSMRPSVRKISSDFVGELTMIFDSNWLTQTIRLFKDAEYAEFEWTVGPIPFRDNISREIITRYETSIQTNGVFYTDSNGRQLMKRRRNFQPTYPYEDSEPVAGNYYPITNLVSIKDEAAQLSIIPDRSHGASSLTDGSVEIMVHRRLLETDFNGINVPTLNETGTDGRGLVVRGKHWLLLDQPQHAAAKFRPLMQAMFHRPKLMFYEQANGYEISRNVAGLTFPLPVNLNLLTVEPSENERVLLRFEHIFGPREDALFSQDVTVNITNLFTMFEITSCAELNLSATIEVNNTSDVERLKLRAMQIRTLSCKYKLNT